MVSQGVPARSLSTLRKMAHTEDIYQRHEELLTLDKILAHASYVIDPRLGQSFRNDLDLTYQRDYVAARLVANLTSTVLAEKIVDKTIEKQAEFEHKVVYPATWWHHFKNDVLTKTFLTRWFVRWRPVLWKVDYKYETATLTANFKQYAKYPACDYIVAPGEVHKQIIVPHEELTYTFREPKRG